jgi:glycine betaine/proline transport system ATP-binding protein
MDTQSEAAPPVQAADQGAPALVQVRDLWKVFGRDAKGLLKKELRDASKQEILSKAGSVLALRRISFEVKRGEFFVLMGLSGSGKSTLIRALIRLIRPTRGEIWFAGENICTHDKDKLTAFRRGMVSMVFQNYGLLPHKTVLENAAFGLKIRGLDKEERRARARNAIETVGLTGWEDYYPGSLSGGMQQRVGLARALATESEILLMDEPFSGLDPLIRRQMQDELIELQGRLHKTVIFVTHDLHEALKLGDRIAIMRDGEIIQIGTPEDIITTPADDYVQEFVRDASPAKVLTAGSIMEEPESLLYEWQGPKAAILMIREARKNYAFVINKQRKLQGLVTLESLGSAAVERLDAIMSTDIPTCSAETTLEELFPLADASPYPVAVVDEEGKLIGEVSNRVIISNMSLANPEEDSHD